MCFLWRPAFLIELYIYSKPTQPISSTSPAPQATATSSYLTQSNTHCSLLTHHIHNSSQSSFYVPHTAVNASDSSSLPDDINSSGSSSSNSEDNQLCNFVDHEPVIHTTESSSELYPAVSPHAHTEIHFEENDGQLNVNSQAGNGSISVVLACSPSRSSGV